VEASQGSAPGRLPDMDNPFCACAPPPEASNPANPLADDVAPEAWDAYLGALSEMTPGIRLFLLSWDPPTRPMG
jgi:hypothetical protein